MRRVRSLALLALALLPLLVGNARVGAATTGDPAKVWQADFDRCLAESRNIAVLFLIDESYSLYKGPGSAPGADVEGKRVEAVTKSLAGLTAITKADGAGGQKVFVAMDGFGASYKAHGSTNWTELNEKSLGGLQQQAEAFRGRYNDEKTDYRAALRGADEAMARFRNNLAGGVASGTCAIALWFTDGDYDTVEDYVLVPTEIDQINAQICAPGTAADRLRETGVHLVAVALSGPGQTPDFGQLRRIAQAEDGCGAQPRRGTVIDADPSNLVDQIVRSSLGFTADPRRAGACSTPSDSCAEFRFTVDPWVTSFRLLVESDRAGLTTTLQGPAGTGEISREPGDVMPGVTRETVTSKRSLVIGNRDAVAVGGWSGEWVVRFSGNGAAASTADLRIIGEVDAAFEGDSFDREGTEPLTLLVTPKKSAVKSAAAQAELRNLEVDVAFRGFDGPPIRKKVAPDGRVSLSQSDLRPVLGKLGQAAKLSATVTPQGTVTVRPEGAITVPLPAVEASIRLRLGDGYPILGAAVVTGFENSTEGTLEVPVTGPKEGSATVSVPKELVLADDADFALTVQGDRVCEVAQGASKVCTWKLEAVKTANLDGKLDVPLTIAGTAVDATTPLDAGEVVEFSMTRPMNSAKGLGMLALLVVLFVLTQLALKVWNVKDAARFIPVDPTTRLVNERVLVGRDGRITAPDGQSLRLAPADLKFAMAFTDFFVTKEDAGLRFAVSQMKAFIKEPKNGVVTAPSPLFTKAGFTPVKTGTPTSAPIKLALREQWVVVLDDATPAGSADVKPGRLVMFVGGADPEAIAGEVARATQQVADSQHASELFAALEAAVEKPTPNPMEAPVPPPPPAPGSVGAPPPPSAPPVLDDPYR